MIIYTLGSEESFGNYQEVFRKQEISVNHRSVTIHTYDGLDGQYKKVSIGLFAPEKATRPVAPIN